MNIKQKENVREMREAGASYAKIAKALSLSENTVKSFCKRNQFSMSWESIAGSNSKGTPFCLNCGMPVTQTQGYRGRKYCSDKCRISWWNKHPAAPGRKKTRSFACLACGKQFDSYGKRERKFCSRSCCNSQKAGCP